MRVWNRSHSLGLWKTITLPLTAWRVRPVLVLPVTNLAILAHGIGPVVPSLGAGALVNLTVGLHVLLNDGLNVIVEDFDGLVAGHHSVKVVRHVVLSFAGDVINIGTDSEE